MSDCIPRKGWSEEAEGEEEVVVVVVVEGEEAGGEGKNGVD